MFTRVDTLTARLARGWLSISLALTVDVRCTVHWFSNTLAASGVAQCQRLLSSRRKRDRDEGRHPGGQTDGRTDI